VLHLDLDTPATKGSLHITPASPAKTPTPKFLQNTKVESSAQKFKEAQGFLSECKRCYMIKLFIDKNLTRFFYELLTEHRSFLFFNAETQSSQRSWSKISTKPDFPQEQTIFSLTNILKPVFSIFYSNQISTLFLFVFSHEV
jgi:hypothetical protein